MGGRQTLFRGFTKLRDLFPLDLLTPHHHQEAVPQTVGPEPQGTGVVHPLLRMAGHTGQREANRQLTSVLPATTALAKMTIIVPVEPKNLNTFLYKIKSGTLVAIGYCVAFTFTQLHHHHHQFILPNL